MQRSAEHSRVRRALALTASGALVAGVIGATLATGTTAAGAASVEKSYAYKCKIKAGGFGINPAKVKVSVAAKLPKSVDAGSTIAARRIKVTLLIPEEVRLNAVDILHARKANGKALKPSVGVKVAGTRVRIPVKGLNAKKSRIPRRNGAPWRMRASGKVAAIKVPRSAEGKAKVSMPKRLNVNARLFRKNGSRIKATMRCTAPKNRGFGAVTIVG